MSNCTLKMYYLTRFQRRRKTNKQINISGSFITLEIEGHVE